MPLLQRQIEPRYLGRQQLHESVRSDLGAAFVNSLAGVIRQLGSLSKQAEDLLSQIFVEIQKVNRKADALHVRIEGASYRVLRLNPKDEQVRIDDIGTQQHFRSHFGYSKEQTFDALEMPSGVVDLYYACPSTPHLMDFDKYREDGKKSLKLYTDPSYFFTLWLEEQKRMMEKTAVKKRRRRKKTRETRAEDIRVPKRKVYKTELDMLNEPLTQEAAYVNAFTNHASLPRPGHGTMSSKTKPTASTGGYENVSRSTTLTASQHHRLQGSPMVEKQETRLSTPPPSSPPTAPDPRVAASPAGSKPPGDSYSPAQHVNKVTQIQPTPVHASPVPRWDPTPPKDDSQLQPVSLPSHSGPAPFSSPAQPPVRVPPPPPPPPSMPASHEETNSGQDQTHLYSAPPSPTHSPAHRTAGTIPRDPPPPPAPAPPPIVPPEDIALSLEPVPTGAIKAPTAAVAPRNDLLDAIRQGKKLRTVEPLTVPKTTEFQGMDVASILARRVAFVSESESEEGSDEEEWSD